MTQQNLQKIFESEFNWNSWKEVMNFTFPEFKFNLVQSDLTRDTKAHKKSAGHIKEHGNTTLSSTETLTLCEVLVKDNVRLDRNIKSVRSLVADLVVPNYQTIVAVFHNADNTKWRFTLVVKEFTDTHKAIDKKPDSYTYVFGVGEKGRTASERFFKLANTPNKTLRDLEEAFSVEALSKKFFREYKDIYKKFVESIVTNQSRLALFKENTRQKQEKSARDFVKKMMGRVVFLYFLQKKGWLGCKTKWRDGDEEFMKTFMQRAKQDDLFYHNYLEPLFFDTLNDKRTKHDEDCIIQKTNFGKVPYLNGGLFEKDENHPKGLTLEWTIFNEFFNTLNNYNFTIIEDDPEFKEVAVDPEMLGHIFENLLEDNKDKGTFYTPKEIVHYMCQESLFGYLRTYLIQNNHWPSDGNKENEKSLHRFIKQKLASGIIDYDKPISKALRDVKICDPAIGSGAFPMGLLNEIYNCVHKLHDESPDVVGDIWGIGRTWKGNKVKLSIIQNSIYGVDVEKGAVDIARLRFWLSLIVDEPEPTPLPNLDYKIMQGNSLLESFEGVDLKFDRKRYVKPIEKSKDLFGNIADKDKQISIAEAMASSNFDLLKMERDYFATENPVEKEKIRKSITQFEKKFIDGRIADIEKSLLEKIKVIGKKLRTDRYETAKQKKNDERLMKECEEELVTIEQAKTNAQKIKEGNKPYFLWSLYFLNIMENGGFDIVIGNPPYVQLSNNNGALAKMYENVKYETFKATGDIYLLFYEKGWQLLKPKGVLCFITSNSWLRASYGESARKFIADKANPILLIDFAGQKIFESATVEVNILMFEKDRNQQNTIACVVKENVLNELNNFVTQRGSFGSFNNGDSWVILSEIEKRIREKIERVGTPLKDWDVQINYGIKTGFNEAFIITGEQRKKLIDEDPKSAEIIRPILRGRDVKKYGYDFADLWLINTHNGIKERAVSPVLIDDYPAVKRHLNQFLPELKKRTDKGDTPYNLRNCAYMDDFNRQKIVWIELADVGRFALDSDDKYLTLNGTFIMVGKDLKYICSVLNNPVTSWHFNTFCISSGVGTNQWRELYVRELFVPRISEEQKNRTIDLFNEIASTKDVSLRNLKMKELDYVIYSIYKFDEKEIEFIENQ